MKAQRKTVKTRNSVGTLKTTKKRSPLSVVPDFKPKSRRRIPRIYKIGACIIAYAVISLGITVDISKKQYEIVALKHELRQHEEANEILRSNVRHYETPQYLASKAKELGMIKPSSLGVIDLTTNKVQQGKNTSTAEQQEIRSSLDMPKHPDQHIVDGIVSTYVPKIEPKAAEQPVKTTEKPQAAIPQESQKEQPKAPSEPIQQEKRVYSNVELNGGSIPAPKMRNPSE